MSLFDTLKKAIFYNPLAKSSAPASPPPASASAARPVTPTPASTAKPAGAPTPASAPTATSTPAAAQTVDVEGVREGLNAKSAQKLNWRTSIVDLMKLVGLDPSLQNRKELAGELGYRGDTNDSAAMNIWLHKAVMQKLAE